MFYLDCFIHCFFFFFFEEVAGSIIKVVCLQVCFHCMLFWNFFVFYGDETGAFLDRVESPLTSKKKKSMHLDEMPPIAVACSLAPLHSLHSLHLLSEHRESSSLFSALPPKRMALQKPLAWLVAPHIWIKMVAQWLGGACCFKTDKALIERCCRLCDPLLSVKNSKLFVNSICNCMYGENFYPKLHYFRCRLTCLCQKMVNKIFIDYGNAL